MPTRPDRDTNDDGPRIAGHEVDQARIRRAVREILLAVGEDPDREGLLKTPNRVARSFAELMAGLRTDPKAHLKMGDAHGQALGVYSFHLPPGVPPWTSS